MLQSWPDTLGCKGIKHNKHAEIWIDYVLYTLFNGLKSLEWLISCICLRERNYKAFLYLTCTAQYTLFSIRILRKGNIAMFVLQQSLNAIFCLRLLQFIQRSINFLIWSLPRDSKPRIVQFIKHNIFLDEHCLDWITNGHFFPILVYLHSLFPKFHHYIILLRT